MREWIWVIDNCKAIWHILKYGNNGEIYNIGKRDNRISNINLIRCILEILDKPQSLIKFVEDRKGHDRKYAIDSRKLINELMFIQKDTPPLHYLGDTIDWYLEHQDYWED